MDFYYLCPRFI